MNQRDGLPQHLFNYVSSIVPMINIDIILIEKASNYFALVWRDDGLYGPGWHIPGGIIRFKEGAKQRIIKTIISEIGVKPPESFQLLEINEIMNHTRDVRGHFISMLYKGIVEQRNIPKYHGNKSTLVNKCVYWFDHFPEDVISQHKRYRKTVEKVISKKNEEYEVEGNLL